MTRRAKTPPTEEQIAAIKAAVEIAGGQGELATGIGVTAASVSNWCAGVNGVTANNAKKIDKFTNGRVKATQLSTRLLNEKIEKEKDSLELYR